MGVFEETIRVLSDSLRNIDPSQIEKLVENCSDTLDKGNKIIVSGLGKNVPICEKFVGTMISLGMNANFLNTNSAVHGDMGIVKNGDLVIILTKSGETGESIYLTQKLMKRDVELWLLTFSEHSTLIKTIPNSVVVKMEHEGDLWNIVPNNSSTLNLIVLQTIAINLAKKRGISINEFRQNHPGGHIGQLLCEDI